MGIIEGLRDGIEKVKISSTAVTIDRQSHITFVVVILTEVGCEFVIVLGRKSIDGRVGLETLRKGRRRRLVGF